MKVTELCQFTSMKIAMEILQVKNEGEKAVYILSVDKYLLIAPVWLNQFLIKLYLPAW